MLDGFCTYYIFVDVYRTFFFFLSGENENVRLKSCDLFVISKNDERSKFVWYIRVLCHAISVLMQK